MDSRDLFALLADFVEEFADVVEVVDEGVGDEFLESHTSFPLPSIIISLLRNPHFKALCYEVVDLRSFDCLHLRKVVTYLEILISRVCDVSFSLLHNPQLTKRVKSPRNQIVRHDRQTPHITVLMRPLMHTFKLHGRVDIGACACFAYRPFYGHVYVDFAGQAEVDEDEADVVGVVHDCHDVFGFYVAVVDMFIRI